MRYLSFITLGDFLDLFSPARLKQTNSLGFFCEYRTLSLKSLVNHNDAYEVSYFTRLPQLQPNKIIVWYITLFSFFIKLILKRENIIILAELFSRVKSPRCH